MFGTGAGMKLILTSMTAIKVCYRYVGYVDDVLALERQDAV